MSYRIQIELGIDAPLKDKVLLHRKFVDHYQRRRRDPDARGRTRWGFEFFSEREVFTVIWSRRPQSGTVASTGPNLRWQAERFMGFVTIRFSARDLAIGGMYLVTGDWAAIEAQQRQQEKVS